MLFFLFLSHFSFVPFHPAGADQYDPVLRTCPRNMEQEVASATVLPAITWTTPTAYDASGPVRLVMNTHSSGDTFPIGTTSVEYLFEDTVGKTTRCVFNVVVTVQGECLLCAVKDPIS